MSVAALVRLSLPCATPQIRRGPLLAALALVAALACGGRDAVAANYFWTGTTSGTTWATANNWSSNYAIGGPLGIVPGASDTAFFNQSTVNTAQTVTLNANASVGGVVFNNTAATTLVGDATLRNLTIGSGGIRVNPGAGAVTLGTVNSATTTNVYAQLSASQTWTNNSANAITIAGQLSSAASQNYTLTIGGSGAVQTQGNATTANQGRIINPAGGTTAVVKNGGGTLTFNESATAGGTGVNAFTGGLTVNAGRVSLNSTITGGNGMTNIIGTQAVTMGGGQLSALWQNSVATLSNQQTFTSLTLTPGASLINTNNTNTGTASNSIINFTTINRDAGATLTLVATGAGAGRSRISGAGWTASTIILDNGVAYATAFGSLTSTPNPGAFADNWAAPNASSQVANNSFAVTYTAATSGSLTGNADMTTGVDTTLATSQTSTSLRFNLNEARTITIGAGNTFTTGGILVTSTVAGNLSTITGGTLQSAATVANKDLVFILNNATGTTAVSSVIVDAAAGATGLTKSGPGTLSLTGANTYTGPTFINGGVVAIGSESTGASNPLGAYPGSVTANAISLNGGALRADASLTIAANRGITLGGNGGTLDAAAGQTLTVNSSIAGAAGTGSLTKGANQSLLILGASNSFTGGLAVAGGTVQLAASNPGGLGTGPVAMAQSNTGAVGASSVLSLNGNSVTIADLRTTGTVGPNPAVLQNASATPVTLTIGDDQNLSGSVFAGIIQDGAGGGALNLVKTGAGTVTLNPSIVRGVTTTTGTNVVLVSDTSFFRIGTQLAAPGIGAGVTITAINSGSITLSSTATASATVTGTFFQRLNNGVSGTVTVANGQLVSSYGFGANTPLVVGDATANTAGAVRIAGSQSVSSLTSAGTAGLGNKVLVDAGNTFTITGTTLGGTPVNSTFDGSIGQNSAGTLAIGVGGATPSGAVTLGGSNAIPAITVAGGTAVFANPLAVASGAATIQVGSGGNSGTNPTLVFRTPSTMVSSTGAFGALLAGPISTGGVYTIVLDYSGSAAFNQSLARYNVGGSSTANATINAINVGSGTGSISFTDVTYSQAAGTNPGTITANASVIISGSVTTNGTPSGNGSPALVLGGTATGSRIDGVIMNNTAGGSFVHAVQITKTGSGTWTLAGANTYTGTTNVVAGRLQIGNSGTSGSLSPLSVLTGSAGATLAFNRSNTITQGADFSSVIGGAMNVAQVGSGTLVLNGANTYTGTTTIAGGMLQLGSGGATGSLATGGVTIVTGSAGSTFAVNRSNTVTQGTDFPTRLTGAMAFAQVGTGTTVLNSSSNSYTGGSRVEAGELRLGNAAALGSTAGSLAVNGGTLNLDGLSPTVGVFSGSSGAVVTSAAAATLTTSSTASTTFAGAFTGAAGLTQNGTGLLDLTGSSSSTGAFAVNSGSLAVNGVLGTGPVSVAAAGWLQGSGTIGGAVNVLGTLSPGNSPGVITLGSVTLGGSSSTIIEINGLARGTQYDGVTITGTGSSLQYGGLLSLSFGNVSAFDNGTTFDIFDFAGLFSGTYANVTSTGFYSGTWASIGSGTYRLVSGAQTLTFDPTLGDIVVVPEPAAIALAGIGLGLAGRWLTRRHRRRA